MNGLLVAMMLLTASPLAHAAGTGRAPVVTAGARAQAAQIASMTDTDPVGRVHMVLEAAKLDEPSLFALAETHPGIVEHLTDPHLKVTVDYLRTLPATELRRLQQGETIIRNFNTLKGAERKAALVLAERMAFPKYKEKKLGSMRLGPFEARIFRVEITYNKSKKKLFTEQVEMAWPSTPERDEKTRDRLARHFGARPTRMAGTAGTPLPVNDASFEQDGTLGDIWDVVDGVMLGTDSPSAEVAIDDRIALDGSRSVRFNATNRTRLFPEVVQHVPVQAGTPIRARAQFRAQNLRVEYQQREDQIGLSVTWLDSGGYALGSPERAIGRLTSHPWEVLEVTSTAPAGATMARIGIISAVSGTAWFDAVSVVVNP